MQILIIDDQHAVRDALGLLFEVHGLAAITAAGPQQALDLIRSENVGLVVQDMNFAEGETAGEGGMALFRAIRALDPDLPVLLMTAWTSLETAVALMREGAADYFGKPWDDAKLLATIKTLLHMRELAYENRRLTSRRIHARRAVADRHALCGLVYGSDVMHELVLLAAKVAPSDAASRTVERSSSARAPSAPGHPRCIETALAERAQECTRLAPPVAAVLAGRERVQRGPRRVDVAVA